MNEKTEKKIEAAFLAALLTIAVGGNYAYQRGWLSFLFPQTNKENIHRSGYKGHFANAEQWETYKYDTYIKLNLLAENPYYSIDKDSVLAKLRTSSWGEKNLRRKEDRALWQSYVEKLEEEAAFHAKHGSKPLSLHEIEGKLIGYPNYRAHHPWAQKAFERETILNDTQSIQKFLEKYSPLAIELAISNIGAQQPFTITNPDQPLPQKVRDLDRLTSSQQERVFSYAEQLALLALRGNYFCASDGSRIFVSSKKEEEIAPLIKNARKSAVEKIKRGEIVHSWDPILNDAPAIQAFLEKHVPPAFEENVRWWNRAEETQSNPEKRIIRGNSIQEYMDDLDQHDDRAHRAVYKLVEAKVKGIFLKRCLCAGFFDEVPGGRISEMEPVLGKLFSEQSLKKVLEKAARAENQNFPVDQQQGQASARQQIHR